MKGPILPGATLGVLGGGQLGRMFCLAARTMGYRLVVLDPDTESPAGRIADKHIKAGFTDNTALDELASLCDVITTEFENVPAESLRYLARLKPVFPSAESLEISQNRDREKQYAQSSGLKPVPYQKISDESDLDSAADITGFPAILKSATMGYDGKGQAVVENSEQLKIAYTRMGHAECVLEKKINLSVEISAIVSRNPDGESVAYPVSENQHRNGVLHMSIVPARVDDAIALDAKKQALALADKMRYVGILAVEYFVSTDGELLFNEMAPRPHNSGHYTKDACVTSQFEQQVRMMCGLPPGDTRLLSPVVMVNLLGDLWDPDWITILQQPGVKLHLYGKKEARPGRKMGHFNSLDTNIEDAIKTAEKIFEGLN